MKTFYKAIGVVGELLITLGFVLLLYAAYQLWWTNVEAEIKAEKAVSELRTTWEAPPSGPEKTPVVVAKKGQPFGLMYIPRLREKVWAEPIIEGVTLPDLARGIGHYPKSVLPGKVGNFAVAGHRSTNGEPLANIDALRKGDLVIVETAVGYYTYKLNRTKIVRPADTWVIDPVPGEKGAKPKKALLTITTCHPRWGNAERWIWWGDLVRATTKQSGSVPVELLED